MQIRYLAPAIAMFFTLGIAHAAPSAGLSSNVAETAPFQAFDYRITAEDPSPQADIGRVYEKLWADSLAHCDARGGYLASYDNYRLTFASLGVGNLRDRAFATCRIEHSDPAAPPRPQDARLQYVAGTGLSGAAHVVARGNRAAAYRIARNEAYLLCGNQHRRIRSAIFSYVARARSAYVVDVALTCEAEATLP